MTWHSLEYFYSFSVLQVSKLQKRFSTAPPYEVHYPTNQSFNFFYYEHFVFKLFIPVYTSIVFHSLLLAIYPLVLRMVLYSPSGCMIVSIGLQNDTQVRLKTFYAEHSHQYKVSNNSYKS